MRCNLIVMASIDENECNVTNQRNTCNHNLYKRSLIIQSIDSRILTTLRHRSGRTCANMFYVQPYMIIMCHVTNKFSHARTCIHNCSDLIGFSPKNVFVSYSLLVAPSLPQMSWGPISLTRRPRVPSRLAASRPDLALFLRSKETDPSVASVGSWNILASSGRLKRNRTLCVDHIFHLRLYLLEAIMCAAVYRYWLLSFHSSCGPPCPPWW